MGEFQGMQEYSIVLDIFKSLILYLEHQQSCFVCSILDLYNILAVLIYEGLCKGWSGTMHGQHLETLKIATQAAQWDPFHLVAPSTIVIGHSYVLLFQSMMVEGFITIQTIRCNKNEDIPYKTWFLAQLTSKKIVFSCIKSSSQQVVLWSLLSKALFLSLLKKDG